MFKSFAVSFDFCKCFIDLIPKWIPIYYSFVRIQINSSYLVLKVNKTPVGVYAGGVGVCLALSAGGNVSSRRD